MKHRGERFFSSTRGHVILLLRKGSATVSDLADELDLTRNAVRAHLNTLERDGLIWQSGKRRGVRKPEIEYALTAAAEDLFPKAYHLLLNQLITVLRRRLLADEVEQMLKEVGTDLALETGEDIDHEQELSRRVQLALDVLENLGGLAELVETGDGFLIRGYSCPLAKTVQDHPNACLLAESLLTRIVGVPVQEVCDREGTPRCRFKIDRPQ